MQRDATTPSDEEKLYLALSGIPAGRVIAYGELARRAGLPGRARWVGRTLSQLPEGSGLPWHRVINANRRISLPSGSPGHLEQRQRLLSEGVQFSSAGTIDRKYLLT
ncbi:MAG: cysteine methyltransferase [Oceanospirillaceae bacterium]|uniref:MGMT family protein n=1 Tax=unclassified Thalassolituus TaxID=2624967 RepID=UPI000C101170|nr:MULTISPECIES: MGMT family protein [unclassified Thalassolituus]MAE34050.1 cysteine methyltransferase [Oceanospirillaceae bacterium]MBN57629.1 cysteine methyltransferase [Oceanospirillaceae bacterium]MDQ4422998.1 MGMT family protein [Thalassolituus sp.]MDQ4424911.1 MGMT family protein [Thalassolituus sp.]